MLFSCYTMLKLLCDICFFIGKKTYVLYLDAKEKLAKAKYNINCLATSDRCSSALKISHNKRDHSVTTWIEQSEILCNSQEIKWKHDVSFCLSSPNFDSQVFSLLLSYNRQASLWYIGWSFCVILIWNLLNHETKIEFIIDI